MAASGWPSVQFATTMMGLRLAAAHRKRFSAAHHESGTAGCVCLAWLARAVEGVERKWAHVQHWNSPAKTQQATTRAGICGCAAFIITRMQTGAPRAEMAQTHWLHCSSSVRTWCCGSNGTRRLAVLCLPVQRRRARRAVPQPAGVRQHLHSSGEDRMLPESLARGMRTRGKERYPLPNRHLLLLFHGPAASEQAETAASLQCC